MQSAAGGTSQRLKPALAMVCSRSRIPSRAPDTLPVLLIVVIDCLPLQPPLPGRSATYDPVAFSTPANQLPLCCLAQFQNALGSLSTSREIHLMPQDMPHAGARVDQKMCPRSAWVSAPSTDATQPPQPRRTQRVGQ